ncbi:MAG: GNAT family N-acetyltransferase, partial [Brucella intermedia]
MGLRTAQISDASVLAAISIEVWLGTYIRRGVNAFFADYVLSEFTEEKFRSLIEDADEHIVVSENKDGLDGF